MPPKKGARVQVDGIQAVVRAFEKVEGGAQTTVREALLEVGQLVLAKAVEYCPMDTGALRASGRVEVEDLGNHWTTLRLYVLFGGRVGWAKTGLRGSWVRDHGYAGADPLLGKTVYYAVYVHERTDAVKWTTAGTGPKYLERAVREVVPQVGRIVGRRMEELTEHFGRRAFGRLTIN